MNSLFAVSASTVNVGQVLLAEYVRPLMRDPDQALSLINQMVNNYTFPDVLIHIDEKLSEEKLAHIIDAIFAGLSAENGGASGVNTIRIAT